MFTVIRQYQVDARDEAEVTALVMGEFGASLRQIPGFINYTWIKGEGGMMFSVGVYSDQAGVEESNRKAAELIRDRLQGKEFKRIGTMQGEVIFHQEM